MAGNRCPAMLHALFLRVSRLGADGVPIVGANNLYETEAYVRFGWEEVVTEGTRLVVTNGGGDDCHVAETGAKLDRYNLTAELCSHDPELLEMMVGGDVLERAGNTVGRAERRTGTTPNPNGVGIEVFTHAWADDDMDPTLPFIRNLFPKTYDWRISPREVSNSAFTVAVLTGKGKGNAGYGTGPRDDWEFPGDTDAPHLWAQVADLPATAQCGYQAVPAGAGIAPVGA